MASKHYPKGAEKIIRAQINYDSDAIKVALVSTSYTYSDTHEFFADLGAAVVGTPQELIGKSTAGGVFDAGDPKFAVLAPGSTVKALVLYKDTGVPGTSALLQYIDSVTGFPMATNGGDIEIPWNNGQYKIWSM